MAVCGRCWVCGSKFDCRPRESCGDCTKDQPARVAIHVEGDVVDAKICGRCVDLIEAGPLGALVHALRGAVGEVTRGK